LASRIRHGQPENGLISGILVIARTEQKSFVSPAILAMFDEVIDVPLPGVKQREAVLKACIGAELKRVAPDAMATTQQDVSGVRHLCAGDW
jgi:SpoVK/Ycf46/Vps4 family AAA+-type ATPase